MALTYLRTTPILRSFSEEKAKAFYLGFLGFTVDFEHRFEPGMPLYMGISRDGLRLHISEHHGSGSPGVHIRIEITGLKAFHAEITAKNYPNMRSGLERPEWGGTEMTVYDPTGNHLTFCEADSA